MAKKRIPTCRPKTWGVIRGETITHGWKCSVHGEHGKRYASQELRDQRMAEHIEEHSKKPKKGAK